MELFCRGLHSGEISVFSVCLPYFSIGAEEKALVFHLAHLHGKITFTMLQKRRFFFGYKGGNDVSVLFLLLLWPFYPFLYAPSYPLKNGEVSFGLIE